MLKYSAQKRLFAILWVIQTIHKEEPMYAVLDKVTIKSEILPYLSTAKRGYETKSCLIEIINAILYKLKTGCQWEFLPVEALFTHTVLSYGAVFYHYNKWRKAGEWKELWLTLLDKHRREFDMSSIDLDGSHTTTLRGGEECGYQGRKKRTTTNALYLTDRQGLPIMMSAPKSGEHNDIHDIESVMENIFSDLERANVKVAGLFINADAGFDCDVLRELLERKEVVANICISKRRSDTDGIFVDDELYAQRYSIERTNAWMDNYRTILNRFDTTASSWESWNYLAFAVLLLKKISRKQKV